MTMIGPARDRLAPEEGHLDRAEDLVPVTIEEARRVQGVAVAVIDARDEHPERKPSQGGNASEG